MGPDVEVSPGLGEGLTDFFWPGRNRFEIDYDDAGEISKPGLTTNHGTKIPDSRRLK